MQLHVFEDRHREMVRNCLDFDKAFGVVLLKESSESGGEIDPCLVGTAVRIHHVQEYEDGRMELNIQGEHRFRVRKLEDSGMYLVGLVEPVNEMEIEDVARGENLTERARDAFRILIEGALSRPNYNLEIRFPTDPSVLSFVIANFLPLENAQKQHFLETTDTLERLEDLIPLLEQQILEASVPRYYRFGEEQMREWISPN